MAFTNFYLIAGGAGSADINAGSSIGAAQAAATTNGSWSTVTGIFTAASGTPFAATVVGDYASIYVDGATVAVFVAKVLTVTSSSIIVVDVATIKYGTAPSTSVTGRSCVINGSWNTEQVLASLTTTVPQSTKINIKGNLTITASRTFALAGAATTPLWFSGYNTTPGDLDSDTTNSLAKPIWTLNATFSINATGALQIWSGISIVGNRSGVVWQQNVNSLHLTSRCRFENTSSNSGAIAYTQNGNPGTMQYCWFKTPATATAQPVVATLGTGQLIGCVAEGGGQVSFQPTGSNATIFINCISLNCAGIGFLFSTGASRLYGCVIYNSTSDAIKWTGTPAIGAAVVGCLFATIGGIGINNASGTNTTNVVRACNDYFSCSGGNEVGFGDSPAFFGQTESGSPITSATNMTPVAGSNAINNGFPGIFENESFSSYPAIGAVQPLAAGGVAIAIFGS
jgi:hypothetical protein